MDRRLDDPNAIGFFVENQNDRHLGTGRPVLILHRNDTDVLSARCRSGLCFTFTFFSIIIILVTAVDSGRSSTIIFGVIFSFLLLVGLVYFRYYQLHAHLDRNNNNHHNHNRDGNNNNNNNNTNHNLFDDDDDDEGLRLVLELRRNLQAIQLLQQHQLTQQQQHNQRNAVLNNSRRGLTDEEISKLPKFIYKAPEDQHRIKRQRDDDDNGNNNNNNSNHNKNPNLNNNDQNNNHNHNHSTNIITNDSDNASKTNTNTNNNNNYYNNNRNDSDNNDNNNNNSNNNNNNNNNNNMKSQQALNPFMLNATDSLSSHTIAEEGTGSSNSITYCENGVNYLYHLPSATNSPFSSSSILSSQKHLPMSSSGSSGDGTHHHHHSRSNSSSNQSLECSICLGVYITNEVVIKLASCHHMYHKQCLEEWLKKNNSCPLCKQSVRRTHSPSLHAPLHSHPRFQTAGNNCITSHSTTTNNNNNGSNSNSSNSNNGGVTDHSSVPAERMIQIYDFRSSPSSIPISVTPSATAASAAATSTATATALANPSYTVDIQPSRANRSSSSSSSSATQNPRHTQSASLPVNSNSNNNNNNNSNNSHQTNNSSANDVSEGSMNSSGNNSSNDLV